MVENTRNDSASVGTTSVQACPECPRGSERSQFIIVNTSTTAKVTIVKAAVSAVAGSGIVLNPSGSYAESTDSGYKCYQGAVNAIADVAGGTISIVESFK